MSQGIAIGIGFPTGKETTEPEPPPGGDFRVTENGDTRVTEDSDNQRTLY